MVRPLLAPMAEGRRKSAGPLPGNVRYRLRAMSAATDNVGLFFGEDIFVAFGAIIFMHNFMLESGGIQTEPLHIALWDPDGDLRLSDPRRAPVATRSPSPARAGPDKRRAGERRCGMNFQQTYLYWLAGAVLLVVAIMSLRDKSNPRRLTTGLFWGLYGLVFLLGDWTYQLVGDKRTVNIAVGGVVVIGADRRFWRRAPRQLPSAYPKRKPPARNASATNFSFRRWRFRSSPSLAYCCLTICPHGRWRSSGRATTRR